MVQAELPLNKTEWDPRTKLQVIAVMLKSGTPKQQEEALLAFAEMSSPWDKQKLRYTLHMEKQRKELKMSAETAKDEAPATQSYGTLRDRITVEINKCSAENGSNTPDFILAQFLTDCLRAFDNAVTYRDKWYNRNHNLKTETKVTEPTAPKN